MAGGLFAFLLLVIFIGFGATVTSMVFGTPSAAASRTEIRDNIWTSLPIVGFAVLVLIMGVYIPPQLQTMLTEAAAFLENSHAAPIAASGDVLR